jgi:hypothetical protein
MSRQGRRSTVLRYPQAFEQSLNSKGVDDECVYDHSGATFETTKWVEFINASHERGPSSGTRTMPIFSSRLWSLVRIGVVVGHEETASFSPGGRRIASEESLKMLVEARDVHGEPGEKLQWSTSPVGELSPFWLDYHSIIGKHDTVECQRRLRQVASKQDSSFGVM